MKIIHFENQEQRLAYLKGGFEEITPKKAKKKKKVKKDEVQAEQG